MKQTKIIELCERKGMLNYNLFVEWFSKRFPNESDGIESYVLEWIGRFQKGNPLVYMDSESKKIYLELINNGGF